MASRQCLADSTDMERSEGSQQHDPVPVDLRHYVDFDLERPAATRVYATAGLALDLICLEPRQALPARTFEHSTVVYTVLGGRAWVVTDEAEVTLEPLQAVLVPPAVPHGVRNDSPDPLILQAVVGPPAPSGDATDGQPSQVAPPRRAEQQGAGDRSARRGLLDRLRGALGG